MLIVNWSKVIAFTTFSYLIFCLCHGNYVAAIDLLVPKGVAKSGLLGL